MLPTTLVLTFSYLERSVRLYQSSEVVKDTMYDLILIILLIILKSIVKNLDAHNENVGKNF